MVEAEIHLNSAKVLQHTPRTLSLVAGTATRILGLIACPGDDITAATLAATQITKTERVEAVLPPEDNFKPRLTTLKEAGTTKV